MKPVNIQGHKFRWWTGGNDIESEGNWTWAKSKQRVGDFVWESGQPNAGISDNCLYLHYSWSYKGGDEPCTYMKYPICQVNI